MSYRCQMVHSIGRRCPGATYRNLETCFWHHLAAEARRSGSGLHVMVGQLLLAIGALLIPATLWTIPLRTLAPQSLRIALTITVVAMAIRLVTKGIVLLDYPLSSFRPFIRGFFLATCATAVLIPWTLLLLRFHGGAIDVLLAAMKGAGLSVMAGRGLLAVLFGWSLYDSFMTLTRDLFLWRSRHLQFLLLATTFMIISLALRDPIQVSKSEVKQVAAWQPIIGQRSPYWIAGIAFVIFSICELINVGMRRAVGDRELFHETMIASFPVCLGSAGFALYLARELMIATRLSGITLLTLFSAVISGVLTVLATRLLIRAFALSLGTPGSGR
jgi:hypothetical protein